MYKIRREIGQNNTPVEWETREGWANLTEEEVSQFLLDISGNPAWIGRQVEVVADDGETWSPQEWDWDHVEDDRFGDEEDEIEEDDLSYLEELD